MKRKVIKVPSLQVLANWLKRLRNDPRTYGADKFQAFAKEFNPFFKKAFEDKRSAESAWVSRAQDIAGIRWLYHRGRR